MTQQTTAPFHLELRTTAGVFITDVPFQDRVEAMRVFASLTPLADAYGPHGTHRLVVIGPDHARKPRPVETAAGV